MSLGRMLKCGVAAGVLSAVCGASHAHAATATATATDEGPAIAIEEVVVTAGRREQTLQTAPIAVTAVSNDALVKSNITSVVGLNAVVPGLTVARNNGLSRVIAIRGVGYETTQNLSSQPGVAMFIDGVYLANSISAGVNLVDIDRLEVLRGPQGLLYGQSATGGVINMVTKNPKLDEFSGEVDLSSGTYNLFKGDASINIPVGDTFAVRAAVQKYSHDGFAKAPGLGGYDLDNADDLTTKISAYWRPTNDFSAQLTYWRFKQKSHGFAQKNILDTNQDPRILGQDYAGGSLLKFHLASLTLKYDLPFAQLKFIGGYQELTANTTMDNDRSDFATIHAFDVYSRADAFNRAWTEELTLTSNKGGRFDWIVGAFAMQQMGHQAVQEYNGTTPPPATFPVLTAVPPGGLPPFFAYSANAYLNRRSTAVFGQGTYHLTDKLRVTGGLRYSQDYFSNNNSAFFAPKVYFSHADHAITGKAQLEYSFTGDVMAYATYSRGYKPGGLNINTRPVLVGRDFQAEKLNAYELGAKSRFLDGRVQLNGATFYYDYTNFQYQEEDPIPYQGGVANIPSAHVYGAELEGQFAVTRSLNLTANMTALEGEFTGDYFALDALAALKGNAIAASRGISIFSPAGWAIRAAQVQNTNGNTPPKLPNFAATVALTHTLDLRGGDTLTSRVEVQYRGPFQYRIFNSGALDRVPSYTLVNLNIEYALADRPIELGLTISNLFNKDAIDSRFSDPFGIGSTSNTYVPPRQVFGTVKYAF